MTSGRARPASWTASCAVGGLADDVDVFLGVKQRRKPRPHQLLVVDQRDADHRAAAV